MHLNNDETAFYVRRLILEGDVPFAIDDLYVSSAKFPGLLERLDDKTPFYDLVQSTYKYSFGSEDVSLDASTTRNDEAKLLKCSVGAPLFILRKTIAQADGSPLHYSKSIIRADRISYHFQVDRDGKIEGLNDQFIIDKPSGNN